MTFCRCAVTIGVVAAAGSGWGCSHHRSAPEPANLPHFHDLAEASPPIQTAAKAVVRVGTAQAMATGSFISPSGLLLTNNHVLGATVCPIEGCYLEVTFMHQRGAARQDPRVLFAVPVAVDVGLDLAVAQVYTARNGAELPTSDYLSVRVVDAASLLDTHVTVVGHPEGNLKKWTDGEVVDLEGDWFVSTAYTLPGESGSPVLDDNGSIVGLVHRGPTGEDLFTANGANVYSVGTPSEPLTNAMSEPLPATMLSTAAPSTAADAVSQQAVYANARVNSVQIDGVATDVSSLLGQACDAALARQDYASIEELREALTPCYDAITWLECRTDVGESSHGTVCPTDRSPWSARFLGINRAWRDMNGRLDLYAVSFAIARLYSTAAAGRAAGAQTLAEAVSEAQPTLDFSLANYLVAFGMTDYDGVRLLDYARDYQKVRYYQFEAAAIANTLLWLYVDDRLTRTEALGLLRGLQADPNVGLGDRLYIEDLRYEFDGL